MGSILSVRQTQIMQLLVDGNTRDQIAARLGISPKTVAKHHARMLKRYGVTTRAEMIAQAVKRGDVIVSVREDVGIRRCRCILVDVSVVDDA